MKINATLRVFGFCASAILSAHAFADTTVTLKEHKFDVELANDPASQERGLMFRDSMPDDHGMLFNFTDEQTRVFWMKNCRMPLDILYFDKNYKLVSAQQRVPACRSDPCPTYPSAGPAQFVLELNAGMTDKLGVKPGDALSVAK
ncbi:MAG TPA: DUF192 domain-containing protein [Rudaea sp.]|jgi:hypothetical protein|nr:DUF192 domain-containing protein [Rudaea sp.]